MYKLELHIVCTADSQKLLERLDCEIRHILSLRYSEIEALSGSRLKDFEVGGGVTEVSNVQENIDSLPE